MIKTKNFFFNFNGINKIKIPKINPRNAFLEVVNKISKTTIKFNNIEKKVLNLDYFLIKIAVKKNGQLVAKTQPA